MLNSYDILIITLIVIIIGIIIVINVKKSLNKNLSQVQVKIPDIKIPPSNIIVNVQKQCNSENFDVFVENNKEQKYSSDMGFLVKNNKKNEGFDNTQSEIQNENEIQNESQNESPNGYKISDEEQRKKMQIYNDYNNEEKTTSKNVKYPNLDDVIDYDNYVCIDKKIFLENSEKFENIKKINKKKTQEIIDREPYDDDIKYDSLNFYLKNKRVVPTSFEDGVTRGANIDQYGNYGSLNDIGKIKLNNNNFNFAKPSNYLFFGKEI